MAQHKWHKEIKAWADGGEIEVRWILDNGTWSEWKLLYDPYFCWLDKNEYRIKPQPKESRIIREMKEAIEDLRKSLGKEPQEMINGLTEEETNNTMSVKGLSHTRRDYSMATSPIQTFTAPTEPTHVKETQYLYVYRSAMYGFVFYDEAKGFAGDLIGKIKLEVDE